MLLNGQSRAGAPERSTTNPVNKGKKLVFDGVHIPSTIHSRPKQKTMAKTDETDFLKTAGQSDKTTENSNKNNFSLNPILST